MQGSRWSRDRFGFPTTRRESIRLLAGFTLVSLTKRLHAEEPSAAEATARRRFEEVGLTNVGVSRSEHYLALGDAQTDFREEALAIAERLAGSYREYFTGKELPVKFPDRRMTVVALKGRSSYAAFKGEEIPDAEAGHYDIDADRLVIFDSRGPGGLPGSTNQRRINTLTLVHEAIHQLTFDTGLVSRESDVPVALSEGLATFGELWTRDQPRLGQFNRPRLLALKTHDWIPVEEILTDDTLFEKEDAAQSAYSIAWLLTHTLLKTRARQFKVYLDLVRTRKDATHRSADAEKAFGPLERLDRELKKLARNNL
ncbi:MAG: DUF1570 domain-containing protein [Isosphaeraceae bacterium]